MQSLLEAVQPIAMTSFDRARPLWEFILIEGLDGPDGERAALAMKVHHSLTDGVGGMELLAHLVDVARDAASPSELDTPAIPAPEHIGTVRARSFFARAHAAAHAGRGATAPAIRRERR